MIEPENYEPLFACGTCHPELMSDEERERIQEIMKREIARIEAEKAEA